MALISRIRNNSWILVVMIALGLGGFIIMDMTSGNQSAFGSDGSTLAKIEGRKIGIAEFTKVEQLLYGGGGGNTFSQRDFLWSYYLDEVLVGKEAGALGLGVSGVELNELQFGQNLSPIIEGRFRNQSNFQVDRERLNQFQEAIKQNQLTAPQRAYWAHQEKEIKTDRLKTKLVNMISKAIYTPTWMAEMVNEEQNAKIDFAYVQVPYSEIENSEVALEDEDFQAYLSENKAQYKQEEETRFLEYVVFEVKATPADIDTLVKKINTTAKEFAASTNDTLFLEQNYSTFEPAFFKKEDLDPTIADTLFKLPVGSVYGPYEQEGVYVIAKVMNRMMLPDSVRSRHILLQAEQTPESYAQARRTLDSLKNLIQTGVASFDSLAAKFGTDATRTKGGDLGFAGPGTMVKPFNDLIFFDGKEDSLYILGTQFGVHLVQVTERKYDSQTEGLQVGYVREAIVPSRATQNNVNREALRFASENKTREKLLQAVASNSMLKLETSAGLKENDYTVGTLSPTQSSRDMVRWAYDPDTDVGDVSSSVFEFQDEVNFYSNKYVVAALKSSQEPGIPSVDNIRDQIEAQVINKKKAALIISQVAGKDMNTVASSFKTKVDTATNISFNAGFIPGLGSEPRVVAKAFSLEVGQSSPPIEGENGVYLLKVINKPKDVTPANIPSLRKSVAGGVRAAIAPSISAQLKKGATIKDNRFRFY
ncbi:MAG: hypothetical protein HC892_04230 [Saprospiraceae bacterium]|nr:hypothetical protein [Saprospiraceae bacterium]